MLSVIGGPQAFDQSIHDEHRVSGLVTAINVALNSQVVEENGAPALMKPIATFRVMQFAS